MSDKAPITVLAGEPAALMRRYVGSLYALAEKDGVLDAITADMRNLRRLWDESPPWRMMAQDPRFTNDMAAKAVADVIRLSKVSTLTANFLHVIVRNRRLALLPIFIEGFLSEVAVKRGEHHVDIRSAQALSPLQKENLSTSLNAMIGGKVLMNMIEDPTLIGGLTVKFGSQFIDASVKTKLDHLERNLKANVAM